METYTERNTNLVVENVKTTAKLMHTTKSQIASILGVSERTVDNRFSGNTKTPFTLTELLTLCQFWGVELRHLITPQPKTVQGLIGELENEYHHTLFLLRKQIEMKGEAS